MLTLTLTLTCVAESGSMPCEPRLESTETTVERAGMLMPAARVSVAKTTRSRLSWKRLSTSAFSRGSMPAWCEARLG